MLYHQLGSENQVLVPAPSLLIDFPDSSCHRHGGVRSRAWSLCPDSVRVLRGTVRGIHVAMVVGVIYITHHAANPLVEMCWGESCP